MCVCWACVRAHARACACVRACVCVCVGAHEPARNVRPSCLRARRHAPARVPTISMQRRGEGEKEKEREGRGERESARIRTISVRARARAHFVDPRAHMRVRGCAGGRLS